MLPVAAGHTPAAFERPVCFFAVLSSYKIERWEKEWTGMGFRNPAITKVLTPMKPARVGVRVAPLACFWTALHPDGATSPWFTVPLGAGAAFSEVSIFSMSSYLRTVSDTVLEVSMPAFSARRDWIGRLFA